MAVRFRIDQATRPQGAVDESRHDLVVSQLITLTAIEPAPAADVRYEWEIIDRACTSATLTQVAGTATTIMAPSSTPFAFCVELRAYQYNSFIGSKRRVFGARSMASKLRLPLFSETADPLSTMLAQNADGSTDNAFYSDLGNTGKSGKNWRGWTQFAHELVMAFENIKATISKAMPARIGYTTGSSGNSTDAAAADHVHPNPDISLVRTPSSVAFTSTKTFGAETFALSDHEHAGAAFNVFKLLQAGGTWTYLLGDQIAGGQDTTRMFLHLDMSAATYSKIQLPVANGSYLPQGVRIWGVQAGDGVINFEAVGHSVLEAPEGVAATTGKGCFFLIVKTADEWGASPARWSLMIFPGLGGEGGSGGGEVTPESVVGALAGVTGTIYVNNQAIANLAYPGAHDSYAVNVGYLNNRLSNLSVAGDLDGYVGPGGVKVLRLQGRTLLDIRPADNQVLSWSEANDRWEPVTLSTGGAELPPAVWNADVAGTYPDLDVVGIRDVPIHAWPGYMAQEGACLVLRRVEGGQVSFHWELQRGPWIMGKEVTLSEPTQGQALIFNGYTWEAAAPQTEVPPLGGDVTGPVESAVVGRLQGRNVSPTAPGAGDVLTWSSGANRWEPVAPSIPVVSLGGDLTGTNVEAVVLKLAGQRLSGNNPSTGQALVWNGTYWTPTTISAGGATAIAGDVTGTLSAVTVERLRGQLIASTTPTDGQALIWKQGSMSWEPSAIVPGSVSLAGDVSGLATNTTVNKIRGRTVVAAIPEDRQVLTWNQSITAWEPLNQCIGGREVATTAPADGQALVWNATSSSWVPKTIEGGSGGGPTELTGDVSGPSTNNVLTRMRGIPFVEWAPSTGDLLQYDGYNWSYSRPSFGNFYYRGDFPQDGQVLTFVDYGGESGAGWEARDPTGGGGGDATSIHGRPIYGGQPGDFDVLTWSDEYQDWEPIPPRFIFPGAVGFERKSRIDFRLGPSSEAAMSGGDDFDNADGYFSVVGEGTVSLIEGVGLQIAPRQDVPTVWDETDSTGISVIVFTPDGIDDIEQSSDLLVYVRVASINDSGEGSTGIAPGQTIGVHVGPYDPGEALGHDAFFRSMQTAAQFTDIGGARHFRFIMGQDKLDTAAYGVNVNDPASFWYGFLLRGVTEGQLHAEYCYEESGGTYEPRAEDNRCYAKGTLRPTGSTLSNRRRCVGIHAASSESPLINATISHMIVYEKRAFKYTPTLIPKGAGVDPNVVTMTIAVTNVFGRQAALQAALESLYAGLSPGQPCYQSDVEAAVQSVHWSAMVSNLSAEEPTSVDDQLTLGQVEYLEGGGGA